MTPQQDVQIILMSQLFPLHFCGTQWIEDEKGAIKAFDTWENICQWGNFYQSLPKSRQTSSESYITVLSATKDPVILAKMFFLCTSLVPWTCAFSDTVQIHEVHDTIFVWWPLLLRDILSKLIITDILEQCKNASSRCHIDFIDAKNQL